MADDIQQAIDGNDAAAHGATDQAAGAAKSTVDTLRQGAEQARNAFNDHVVEPAKRAGEALKESGQKIAEGSSALGSKLIDQAETNTSQAFAAMRAAASAKDLSEVMRIQGDYLREQGQRSMNQAREVSDLIMQFGRNAVAPLRGGQDGPQN
ncbi:phasin family protein [Sphingomonas bacterium]|uniref:phasin family protein n=1 Tax=Sphingomonas bacterium TaxID=1895847 RepID=UPI0015776C00|nr:phasin family protein [Sphingomonas bacterium]